MPDVAEAVGRADLVELVPAAVVEVEAGRATLVEAAAADVVVDVLAATVDIVEVVAEGPRGPVGPQGDRGPVGPLGGYVVTQATPAGTWTFTHTVGRLPVVNAYDMLGRRIFPDTTATDTQVVLVFAVPMAGRAVLT